MKFSLYVAIGIAFIICVFTPIAVYTNLNAESEQANEVYASYLTNATHDAASATAYDDGYAFESEAKRNAAIAAFYRSISACFSTSFSDRYFNIIKHYIPCIVLLDNDGMYIHYSADYTASGMIQEQYVTTPLYAFAGNYGDFSIRYYLDGHILASYRGTKLSEGNPADVFYEIEGMGYTPSALTFLLDDTAFHEEKMNIITNTVSDKTRYYINSENNSLHNKRNAWYDFTIPKMSGQDWARAIEAPTVLSFIQGPQMPYNKGYRNIYAMCGGELNKAGEYYIKTDQSNGILYYHTAECSLLDDEDKQKKFDSMEECAKKGAYPCIDCIR